MRRRPRLLENGQTDPRDTDGLSVFDSYRVDRPTCMNDVNCCFGLATLHVGTLLDHGLTVIRDPQDFRKLLITNAPWENPNNPDEERLADTIAESARIVERGRHRRSN